MRKVDYGKLASLWQRETAILAVWVFGSAQQGDLGPTSDVDLALLLRRPWPWEQKADLRAAVQERLQVEDIDLVFLDNDSDPLLAFEALSGRLLFVRDAAARIAYASLKAREYEDAVAFLAKYHGLSYPSRPTPTL
ncbi:MAG: type VII toxin-antitoxin system MntA family adenylyltransferase antitoxin [Polyangiales bacterium]